MGFVFFNLAICVNSILACLFLIYKNKGHQTTLFFAGLIISMCFIVVFGITKDYFINIYKYFVGVEYMAMVIMGAMIYNYTLANLGIYQPKRLRSLLQSLPLFALVIFYIVYMFLPFNTKDVFYNQMMQMAANGPELYVVVAFSYPAIFATFAIRRALQYKKQNHKLSETEAKHILWLCRFNYCFVIIFSLAMISELLARYNFCKYLYIVNLGIYSFYIYQLLVHPKIVLEPIKAKTINADQQPGFNLQKENKTAPSLVIDFIETEKPYLDTELSLVKLSDGLNMSHIQLSQLLNHEMNTSFAILINSYRVKEACRKLTDPTHQNYTIESIANTCGFKSKAAFYEAFKRFKGLTPSEYRKQEMEN